MDSSSDHEKAAPHTVAVRDVDTAATLTAGTDIHLEPAVAAALRSVNIVPHVKPWSLTTVSGERLTGISCR